ncbi:MAG: hypothetical protein QM770_05535 [Tepidisphaeraceae bacterium]
MKRFFIILGCTLFVVVTLVTGLVFYMGRYGDSAAERWIADAVLRSVNDRWDYHLETREADYQYPLRLVFKGVHFREQDETYDILAADQVVIDLAKIPVRGMPIDIRSLEVVKPRLTLRPPPDKPGEKTPSTRKTINAGEQLVSLVTLRQISVKDAAVRFEASDGMPLLVVDQLATELALQPKSADVYALSLATPSDSILKLDAQATFDLKTLLLTLERVTVRCAADETAKKATLEAQLAKRGVAGLIEAELTGEVPLMDFKAAHLGGQVHVTEFTIPFGDEKSGNRVRIPWASAYVNVARNIDLDDLQVWTLDGVIRGHATLPLQGKTKALAYVEWSKLQLAGLNENPKKFSGITTGQAKIAPPDEISLRALIDGLRKDRALPGDWAEAKLTIDGLRGLEIPVIAPIMNAIASTTDAITRVDLFERESFVQVETTLTGNRATLQRGWYRGATVAFQIEGSLLTTGELDLTVRGGPIERIASALGQDFGQAAANLLGAVGSWKVTGTIEKPSVGINPLNLR